MHPLLQCFVIHFGHILHIFFRTHNKILVRETNNYITYKYNNKQMVGKNMRSTYSTAHTYQ
jgi:hypothetical protein